MKRITIFSKKCQVCIKFLFLLIKIFSSSVMVFFIDRVTCIFLYISTVYFYKSLKHKKMRITYFFTTNVTRNILRTNFCYLIVQDMISWSFPFPRNGPSRGKFNKKKGGDDIFWVWALYTTCSIHCEKDGDKTKEDEIRKGVRAAGGRRGIGRLPIIIRVCTQSSFTLN